MGMTPKQFRLAFRTEKQCRDYLLKLKHPNGFRCRRCRHDVHHEIAHRNAWQCASCGYQESAKAGTLFHKSKVTLVDWFQAILEITLGKGGVSAVELKERLGLGSYKTAWGMLHKVRRAMAKRDAGGKLLKGAIEIDGAIIGRRRTGNQGHAYLAVEVTTSRMGKPSAGRLRAGVVGKFRKEEAHEFVDEHIQDGSELICDGGKELRSLDLYRAVEVSSEVMGRRPERHLERLLWVHRVIGNLKGSLVGVYHGVSLKYLDAYIAEYCYRFNRRAQRPALQSRLLRACVASGPVSLADVSG